MTLLTDDEINTMADEYLENYRIAAGCALNFGRDVEQAVLSKLAAGVTVEPNGYDPRSDQYLYKQDTLTTAIAAARVQALEEAAVAADLFCNGGESQRPLKYPVADAIRALIGKEST